jgi:hypothetical protein
MIGTVSEFPVLPQQPWIKILKDWPWLWNCRLKHLLQVNFKLIIHILTLMIEFSVLSIRFRTGRAGCPAETVAVI